MKITAPIKNEDGIALIIALMLLVLLTLLGMAATTTSVLEIQIADNDRDYKVHFYQAETAAYEAARLMGVQVQNGQPGVNLDGSRPSNSNFQWVGRSVTQRNPMLSQVDWSNAWQPAVNNNQAATLNINSNTMYYSAYYYNKDDLSGATSDVSNTDPLVYRYLVYGYSRDNSGQALVELGLKLRY